MKKVLIALGIIIVVIVGGVVLLFSNLDALVESAIETAGTRATGSQVEVGRVELDLMSGAASIYDFSIANPAGYSAGAMASFSELSVRLNVANMDSTNIHISSVVARNPFVLYESIDSVSNFDRVTERLGGDDGAAREPAADGSQPNLRVDSILVEDIRGTLKSDRLPSEVEVSLGDVRLQDLEGTPEELAGQVMRPILEQIGRRAAEALIEATRERLGERAGEVLDEVSERAGEALDRVGNLFRRDEE